jgi:hypothetical protein
MAGMVMWLAALALCPAPAAAGVADQVGATFGLMLADVAAVFPAVEGIVVSVDGDRLYSDLGEQDGVRLGQEFTVFRKGEPFYHTVTRRQLGRFEDVLAHAQVVRVQPRFSEARIIPVPERPEVRVEDGVRITRGRIRVAVAPPLDLTNNRGADLRRVPYMMALGLENTKRFHVADPGVVRDVFFRQRVHVEELLVRPERAVAVGKSLEVAAWLVPVLIERGGQLALDVTWISAVTGSPLFSRRTPLVRAEAASAQRFPWEPRAED